MSKISGTWSKLVAGTMAVGMLGLVGPGAAQTAVSAARGAVTTAQQALAPPTPAERGAVVANLGKLPLRFEANVGQVDPEARFLARAKGATVFLTASEAVLSFGLRPTAGSAGVTGPVAPGGAVVRMRPMGADPQARPEGIDPLPGVTNYLIGDDGSKWHSGVPSYGGVRYRGVYPGIDQVFHGKSAALEYDFEVAPGADPAAISLGLEGPTSVALDPKTGELVLHTAVGEIRQAKPVLYQDIEGARRPVTGGFALHGDKVGFDVGPYDRALPLVIDPVLAYSALFGGSGDEEVGGIDVDASGAAYVTGTTSSTDFPTKNAFQAALAPSDFQQDMFVTKLTPDGSALVYSTYLGGNRGDRAAGIAVDADGAAYVAGTTSSSDFPMAGSSFDTTCGNDGQCRGDVTYPDGTTTAGSTSLTSNQADQSIFFQADAIGASITGANIPAGTTISAVDFDTRTVTLSAPATATGIAPFTVAGRAGGNDVVVAKLTPNGSALAYSTYLGGGTLDDAGGIDVDTQGNAYVTGRTESSDYPTTTTDQALGTREGYDRFCGTSVDTATGQPDGSCNRNVTFTDGSSAAGSPIYRTTVKQFDDRDIGRAITGTNIPAGTVITGIIRPEGEPSYTSSDTFTLSNDATGTGTGLTYAILGRNGQSPPADAFLSKVNTNATTGPASLAYSTYLGGGGTDFGTGVAVEPDATFGGVYVVGNTNGAGFPTTPTAFTPSCDRQLDPLARCVFGLEGFVVKLFPGVAGTDSLTGVNGFGTYLGSRGNNSLNAVAADRSGVYVTGRTDSPSFPTKNAFQQELRQTPGAPQSQDAFVAKLSNDGAALIYSTFLGGTGSEDATGIAVDATGAAYVSGNTSSVDFPTKDSIQGPASGYLTKLAPSGSVLDFSTYLNVSGSVATDPAGGPAAYVAGAIQPADFPALPGSLRAGTGGGADAAVVKVAPGETPLVNSLIPRGGPTTGGTPVVITGDKFTGATAVSFGGVPAASFTIDSPTQITAISPPHAEGSIADLTVFVTVTGPQATSLAIGSARYVYGEGVFLPTGSCAGTRCPPGGQAVRLLDGRVLYTNGTGARFVNDTLPASSQLYNPATGTWAATGTCTDCGFSDFGKKQFSITVLPNGKVLVAGGLDTSDARVTAKAFLYDPATGTWSPTGSMTSTRQGHTATLLPNGKVLVAGGCADSDCVFSGASPLATSELYDPATGVWTGTAGSLTAGRLDHTATLLDAAGGPCGSVCGMVLVAFGTGATPPDAGFDDAGPTLDSSELFDPATGTWRTTGSSVTTGRTSHSAARLLDGRVLAASGIGSGPFGVPLNTSEVYNPADETWRLSGLLNFNRGQQPPLVRLPNGSVLIVGGDSDIAEIWNPADGRWRSATSSAFRPRIYPVAALLLSGPVSACGSSCGKVLVAGGEGDGQPLAVAELYTPRPTLTALTPGTGAGGATVSITGTGLASVSSVRFGSVSTTSVTHDPANPDGLLTVTVPSGATGAVDVTVSSLGGVSPVVPAGRFTVTAPPPPTVGSVSPSGGAAGSSVTITGSGLGSVTSVSFGSVSTTSFTVNPDGSLTVVVPNGVSGVVNVTVTSPTGTSAVVPAGSFTVRALASTFVPVSPARILDTRFGNGAPAARVGAGGTVEVQVTGRGGVPATGVTAVALNLTAVAPTAGSFVTAWPTGESRPLASNVNLDTGAIVPNLAVVKVGTGGKVSLFNALGDVDLLADVAGYYLDPAAVVPGSSFAAVSPARILDTRIGNGAPTARVGAGGTVDVQVTGRGGVPASGVTAVAMNVTAATPSATSFVTAWPAGEARPLASNLNMAPGVTRPNMVIVKVGAGGRVSMFNDAGTVDLLADVAGYYLDPAALSASTFTPVSPTRILDTRFGNGAPTARIGPGQTIDVQVTGAGGVPATGVTSVVMNVTSVTPTAESFMTVWPTGEARPLASNLNMTPGVTVANLVIVKVGAGGKVSMFNDTGTTDLIADVAGYNTA